MELSQRIDSFEGYNWKREINVRGFIQHNYTPFEGDESFLTGPTENTMGKYKYENMGVIYPLDGVEDLSRERAENARNIFRQYVDCKVQ